MFFADDDTRVILKNADVKTGGDYINATYIHVSSRDKNIKSVCPTTLSTILERSEPQYNPQNQHGNNFKTSILPRIRQVL